MVEALKTWRKHNAAMLLATQSDRRLRRRRPAARGGRELSDEVLPGQPRPRSRAHARRFHLNDTRGATIADLRPREQLLLKRPDVVDGPVTARRSPRRTGIYTNRRRIHDGSRPCSAARGDAAIDTCCPVGDAMRRPSASALLRRVAARRAQGNARRELHRRAPSCPVQAKLRFTTLIILPEGERILDFVCGDKDFWIVSGADNLAYVKPAKAGASTNLNLITASGRVYSFLLTEGAASRT